MASSLLKATRTGAIMSFTDYTLYKEIFSLFCHCETIWPKFPSNLEASPLECCLKISYRCGTRVWRHCSRRGHISCFVGLAVEECEHQQYREAHHGDSGRSLIMLSIYWYFWSQWCPALYVKLKSDVANDHPQQRDLSVWAGHSYSFFPLSILKGSFRQNVTEAEGLLGPSMGVLATWTNRKHL